MGASFPVSLAVLLLGAAQVTPLQTHHWHQDVCTEVADAGVQDVPDGGMALVPKCGANGCPPQTHPAAAMPPAQPEPQGDGATRADWITAGAAIAADLIAGAALYVAIKYHPK